MGGKVTQYTRKVHDPGLKETEKDQDSGGGERVRETFGRVTNAFEKRKGDSIKTYPSGCGGGGGRQARGEVLEEGKEPQPKKVRRNCTRCRGPN